MQVFAKKKKKSTRKEYIGIQDLKKKLQAHTHYANARRYFLRTARDARQN